MKLRLSFLALALWTSAASASDNVQVFFSPAGGCTEAVVSNLKQAKSNVFVQAYSFTSAPIAKALVDAAKRGVKVQVILDKSQRTEKYSSADFLRDEGVATFIDSKHAIAHNKIMVIDGATVLTSAERKPANACKAINFSEHSARFATSAISNAPGALCKMCRMRAWESSGFRVMTM